MFLRKKIILLKKIFLIFSFLILFLNVIFPAEVVTMPTPDREEYVRKILSAFDASYLQL